MNPIPHIADIAYMCCHEQPRGNFPHPALTNKNIAPVMPICFPKNNPQVIPSVMGWKNTAEKEVISANETPELTNPNSGSIPKCTHGARLCSICRRGDSPCLFLALRGMQKAASTPAMVACTAEFRTHTHNKVPNSMYGVIEVTELRFRITIIDSITTPNSKGTSSICGV